MLPPGRFYTAWALIGQTLLMSHWSAFKSNADIDADLAGPQPSSDHPPCAAQTGLGREVGLFRGAKLRLGASRRLAPALCCPGDRPMGRLSGKYRHKQSAPAGSSIDRTPP